jgi:hypothetical protein
VTRLTKSEQTRAGLPELIIFRQREQDEPLWSTGCAGGKVGRIRGITSRNRLTLEGQCSAPTRMQIVTIYVDGRRVCMYHGVGLSKIEFAPAHR